MVRISRETQTVSAASEEPAMEQISAASQALTELAQELYEAAQVFTVNK